MAWGRGKRCGKYNAKKTVVDGVTFASKLEARRWNELLLMQRVGEIQSLQRQVPFDLVVNGHLICRYIADFCYAMTETGERVTEDAKGILTPEFRLKAKLMEALYGIVVQIWTGRPRWELDTSKGRWLRRTPRQRSPKSASRGAGSPASF